LLVRHAESSLYHYYPVAFEVLLFILSGKLLNRLLRHCVDKDLAWRKVCFVLLSI
jgi:hypothetical protein